MPFSTAAADYELDQEGANHSLFASLHSAYSATGANELSGGSPAYARQAVTWSAAASNSKALSNSPTLNVPAGSSVAFIGLWDAVSGGSFRGMYPNSAGAIAYGFSAPSSTSILLAPGSAYAANQTVVVFPVAGSALPSGLTAGTIYYVKSPSGDSFQLSATSGGSAITLSADGAGVIQAVSVEAFVSQGTFQVSSGSLAII
ncbi:MAG TPA: hypothetical protein VFB06_11425 [Streptosporangiaceae bacterium]|nr:hypothetical protein [Streptosporangiaceae bacterium]